MLTPRAQNELLVDQNEVISLRGLRCAASNPTVNYNNAARSINLSFRSIETSV